MAELLGTDEFLVNRNDVTYTQQQETLMASLQDTDHLLINRAGQTYKITGEDLINSVVDPLEVTVILAPTIGYTDTEVTAVPVVSGGKQPDGGYIFTYQWVTADDAAGTNKANIAGATDATFTPDIAEVGLFLGCVVSTTDALGTSAEGEGYIGPIQILAEAPVIAEVEVSEIYNGVSRFTDKEFPYVTTMAIDGEPAPTYELKAKLSGTTFDFNAKSDQIIDIEEHGFDAVYSGVTYAGYEGPNAFDISADKLPFPDGEGGLDNSALQKSTRASIRETVTISLTEDIEVQPDSEIYILFQSEAQTGETAPTVTVKGRDSEFIAVNPNDLYMGAIYRWLQIPATIGDIYEIQITSTESVAGLAQVKVDGVNIVEGIYEVVLGLAGNTDLANMTGEVIMTDGEPMGGPYSQTLYKLVTSQITGVDNSDPAAIVLTFADPCPDLQYFKVDDVVGTYGDCWNQDEQWSNGWDTAGLNPGETFNGNQTGIGEGGSGTVIWTPATPLSYSDSKGGVEIYIEESYDEWVYKVNPIDTTTQPNAPADVSSYYSTFAANGSAVVPVGWVKISTGDGTMTHLGCYNRNAANVTVYLGGIRVNGCELVDASVSGAPSGGVVKVIAPPDVADRKLTVDGGEWRIGGGAETPTGYTVRKSSSIDDPPDLTWSTIGNTGQETILFTAASKYPTDTATYGTFIYDLGVTTANVYWHHKTDTSGIGSTHKIYTSSDGSTWTLADQGDGVKTRLFSGPDTFQYLLAVRTDYAGMSATNWSIDPSSFDGEDKVTYQTDGGKGTIVTVDEAAKTITLTSSADRDERWIANNSGEGSGTSTDFYVTPANGVPIQQDEVWCKLQIINNKAQVTNIQQDDPGFLPVPAKDYSIKFPAVFPTGNEPDDDLPKGACVAAIVAAENSEGRSVKESNCFMPIDVNPAGAAGPITDSTPTTLTVASNSNLSSFSPGDNLVMVTEDNNISDYTMQTSQITDVSQQDITGAAERGDFDNLFSKDKADPYQGINDGLYVATDTGAAIRANFSIPLTGNLKLWANFAGDNIAGSVAIVADGGAIQPPPVVENGTIYEYNLGNVNNLTFIELQGSSTRVFWGLVLDGHNVVKGDVTLTFVDPCPDLKFFRPGDVLQGGAGFWAAALNEGLPNGPGSGTATYDVEANAEWTENLKQYIAPNGNLYMKGVIGRTITVPYSGYHEWDSTDGLNWTYAGQTTTSVTPDTNYVMLSGNFPNPGVTVEGDLVKVVSTDVVNRKMVVDSGNWDDGSQSTSDWSTQGTLTNTGAGTANYEGMFNGDTREGELLTTGEMFASGSGWYVDGAQYQAASGERSGLNWSFSNKVEIVAWSARDTGTEAQAGKVYINGTEVTAAIHSDTGTSSTITKNDVTSLLTFGTTEINSIKIERPINSPANFSLFGIYLDDKLLTDTAFAGADRVTYGPVTGTGTFQSADLNANTITMSVSNDRWIDNTNRLGIDFYCRDNITVLNADNPKHVAMQQAIDDAFAAFPVNVNARRTAIASSFYRLMDGETLSAEEFALLEETVTEAVNAQEPFALDGYYPLYYTADKADAASSVGDHHVHNINGVNYYMPDGGTLYHGNYIPPETSTTDNNDSSY